MNVEKNFESLIEKIENAIKAPDVAMENDGIGAYEFWGAKGVDKGNSYWVVQDGDKKLDIPIQEADALVKYYYQGEILDGMICTEKGNDYDTITLRIKWAVKSMKPVKNGIEVIIEWVSVTED